MNVSATYNGSYVQIVDIDVNGSDVYVTYVSGGNLYTSKSVQTIRSASTVIATGATVN